MFFIFRDTIAVNMNLGDQANLAALLRSLVWGEKKKQSQKQTTCCLLQADRGFCSFSGGHFVKPALSRFTLLAAALPAGCCVRNPSDDD